MKKGDTREFFNDLHWFSDTQWDHRSQQAILAQVLDMFCKSVS